MIKNPKAHSRLLQLLLIVSTGLLAYSNSFYCAFHLDDLPSITNNSAIRNIADLKSLWLFWPTRFITYLSVAINYSLHRYELWGYHLFNFFVHLAATVAVWHLSCKIFSKAFGRESSRASWASLIAALVFISHPIQTQAVTYVIQRATSLSALFMLITVICYAKSRTKQNKNTATSYFLAVIFAVLAVFSKENAFILPMLLILYEIYFIEPKPGRFRKLLPFFLISALIPATMFLAKSVDFAQMRRAAESAPGILPSHYLWTQFGVIADYLRLLIIPLGQNIDHDYPVAKNLMSPQVLLPLFLIVSLIMAALRLSRKHPVLSFSIFWFFIALFPESGILPIKDVMFEHRLYLPMLGFAWISAYFLSEMLKKNKKLGLVIAAAVIAAYSILTFQRNEIWKTEWSLWNDAAQKSANKARPYNNRGFALALEGNYEKAVTDYQKALEIDPNYEEAVSNIGFTHSMKKEYDKAIEYYSRAIEKAPENAETYSNRAFAYQGLRQYEKALADYNKAVELKPTHTAAYSNRALLYEEKGDFQSAFADYQKALEIDPHYANAYNNRANAYQQLGEFEKSIADYDQAIRLDSKNPALYSNRGIALGTLGRVDEAIRDFKIVVKILPEKAEGYSGLGSALFIKGDVDEAIKNLSKSIEINEEYAAAYHNRAVAYFSKKDYAQCRKDLERAKSLGYKVSKKLLRDLEEAEKKPA